MTTTATAFAACAKPERYIQQLVSHWGHKMASSYDADERRGLFPFGEHTSAEMTAQGGEPAGIAILLSTADLDDNIRMRGVIERHVDRFAFREAPLTYQWTDSEDPGQ